MPPITENIFGSTFSTTGKCPSTSAAGETSLPVGSVYSGSTDKYYSWSDTKMTWHDAQVQCSARGATLIESRTVEEHEVFTVMQSKNFDCQDIVSVYFNSMNFADALNSGIWTGHVNTDLTVCNNANDCLNKVNLVSDGGHYNTTVYPGHVVIFDAGKFQAIYKNANPRGINDRSGTNMESSACEFTCHKESK